MKKMKAFKLKPELNAELMRRSVAETRTQTAIVEMALEEHFARNIAKSAIKAIKETPKKN